MWVKINMNYAVVVKAAASEWCHSSLAGYLRLLGTLKVHILQMIFHKLDTFKTSPWLVCGCLSRKRQEKENNEKKMAACKFPQAHL